MLTETVTIEITANVKHWDEQICSAARYMPLASHAMRDFERVALLMGTTAQYAAAVMGQLIAALNRGYPTRSERKANPRRTKRGRREMTTTRTTREDHR